MLALGKNSLHSFRDQLYACMCMCVLYFVITAKVMEPAVHKAYEAEIGFVSKSTRKPSTHSDSSSVADSTQPPVSPVRSLTLSTSTEQDDVYIMLDECVSGPSSISPMVSTSSSTPSPGNTLADRNAAPYSVEYLNLDSSGNHRNLGDLPPRYDLAQSPARSVHTRRSMDAVFEGNNGKDVGVWDHATNPDFTGHSKSGNGDLAPALPAKTYNADVEYDVPLGAPVRGSASHPAPSAMHGSSAPPPQPHMAIPGRMHRYVNAAPIVVRSQTPTSSATQKNYAEASAAIRGPSSVRPAYQNTANSSPLLPPKAHG